MNPVRIVKMWPWVAAACVAGVAFMLLTPPKVAEDNIAENYYAHNQQIEMQFYVRDYDDMNRYGDFGAMEKRMLARSIQMRAGIYINENDN